MSAEPFYGAEIARAHHDAYGWAARNAAETVRRALAERRLTSGAIVELGCGTGISCRILADAGYDVTGVDLSDDMLAIARQHVPGATFRQGSVYDVELPSGVVAVTAVGEILSYAADDRVGIESVAAVAQRVHEALVPGGVFLFDLAVPGRAGPTGERVTRQVHDGLDVVLEAREDDAGTRLDRHITMYRDQGGGCWSRTVEHHVLRLVDAELVVGRLVELGFAVERLPTYTPVDTSLPVPPGWVVLLARRPA